MEWEVEYTDEFAKWWDDLSEKEQGDVTAYVRRLRSVGPILGYPYSSDVKGSRHGAMRELRVQSGGKPLRIFYAFDRRRTAILLIGGAKAGNDRFYEQFVHIADHLFDQHLVELKKEQAEEATHDRTSSFRGTGGENVAPGKGPGGKKS